MKRTLQLIAFALLLLSPASFAATPEPEPRPDTKIIPHGPEEGGLPNQWIVVLERVEDVDLVLREYNLRADFVYRAALYGFAGKFSDEEVAALAADVRVLYVEQDGVVTTQETQQAAVPTWGLDRIEQRWRNFTGPNWDGSYWYYNTGGGVHAYIIDTGIWPLHTQLAPRVLNGPGQSFTAILDGNGTNDCHGHGTHVAGTVGATTHGVAKNVWLHPVRVLPCSGFGTFAAVIAGVNFVFANHVKPAVTNMSVGGGFNAALNTAVNNLVNAGVFTAVAAANNNANACSFSPASAANAMTVAATDSNDAKASFSNWGNALSNCIDINAPGVSIPSTYPDTIPVLFGCALISATPGNRIVSCSGTSMASPHVAGVAALYLETYPWASPTQTRTFMMNTATNGALTGLIAGTPNIMVHSKLGSLANSFGGTLTLVGQQAIHPTSTWYFAGLAGLHEGRLTGPIGTNFDLQLFRWNGLMFIPIVTAASASSNEHIVFHDAANNLYYWVVTNQSGAGAYTFQMSQP